MTTQHFVLLSGGIDSTTVLARVRRDVAAMRVHCLSVDYGQRHRREIVAAQSVAAHYEVDHDILDLRAIVPRTMLTDPSSEIPEVHYNDLPEGISPTYVPFRNGLMLSAVASRVQGMLDPEDGAVIHFGAHADDSARWAYPDCSPEFVGAMANAIFVGTYQHVRLEVPLQYMVKDEIIKLGTELNAPYNLTWSCYKGGELHCGTCPTCRSRWEGFIKAEVVDPTVYLS